MLFTNRKKMSRAKKKQGGLYRKKKRMGGIKKKREKTVEN